MPMSFLPPLPLVPPVVPLPPMPFWGWNRKKSSRRARGEEPEKITASEAEESAEDNPVKTSDDAAE